MANLNIKFNNKSYSIDPASIADALASLEGHLAVMVGEPGDTQMVVPGLYETGAIALYDEQGAEAIESMLITPWDELIESGAIVVDNSAASIGVIPPDNLPSKNEYGFYYGVAYNDYSGMGIAFNEDASVELYMGGNLMQSFPAGTAAYSQNTADMSSLDFGVALFSSNGMRASLDNVFFDLGSPAKLSGDLLLPNGSITTIKEFAFITQSSLTGILIPSSVTDIGQRAFASCSGLTSIEFSADSKLASIGDSAFYYCTGLTSIKIPDSVISIDQAAFEGCAGLTIVEFGADSQLTSIGNQAFRDCALLTDITIPVGVTTIGEGVFANCTSLKGNLVIPVGVTCLRYQTFYGCTSLHTISYEGTSAQWNAIIKEELWCDIPATHVHCTDGDVAL